MTKLQNNRARISVMLAAVAVTLGLAGITEASEISTSKMTPRQSHCLADSSVEEVLRNRLGDILDPDRDDDAILDTLNMAGSTFTRVTVDSVCAKAVIA